METVVTIAGADKAGALARLVVFCTQRGYAVKGQRFAELPSGARLLKIRLSPVQIDKRRLAAELAELDAAYSVLSITSEDSAGPAKAQTPAQAAAALVGEMSIQYPDIVALVRAYASAFDVQARTRALFEAGKKLGTLAYGRDAAGSPLRMPQALRGALVPALEKFCAAEATDTQIDLPQSPFCAADLNCCDFVTGFMQGFLDAGLRSIYTKVQQANCRSRGHPRCTYTVAYDL